MTQWSFPVQDLDFFCCFLEFEVVLQICNKFPIEEKGMDEKLDVFAALFFFPISSPDNDNYTPFEFFLICLKPLFLITFKNGKSCFSSFSASYS